jgi:TRAP-type mannitol/chloroaromatic compound transport system permease small subunit
MIKKIFLALLLVTPSFSFAAHVVGHSATGGLSGVIDTATGLANQLYSLVFVLIILAFAWGVLVFVFKSGEDSTEGKNMMIWSIVALFVLVSVWGIIGILQKTVGVDNKNAINAPGIPTVPKQ